MSALPHFSGAQFVPERGWQVIVEGAPTARFYVDPLAALSDAARTLEARMRARTGRSRRRPAIEADAANEGAGA